MELINSVTLPLAELYAPVREDLAIAEQVFDRELVSEFAFVNTLCDTVRSYRGKMLRPALLLLSAKAAGSVSRPHHTLAAVVEIVHMATLVHDDVLDEAEERRRRPAIRALAGNRAAVLLGDYLISHAFHLCSGLPDTFACRRIGAATNIVCEGEMLQNHRCGQHDLSEEVYFDIVRRKTAALTATACELGAYYAGADESAVEALRVYGESAGIAFQIMDDCLDIVGDPRTVGKTLGRDLASGKLTLPTLHCLNHADRSVRSAMTAMVAGDAPCDRGLLREWLLATGSLDYAVEAAEGYVAEARRKLDVLPPGDAKSSLVAMAEFVIQRNF